MILLNKMKFTNTVIEEIVQAHYELTVKAKSLDGYDELNFILTESVDKKYILKIAGEQHDKDFIDAQIKIIAHLRNSPIADQLQYYINNKKGEALTIIEEGGKIYYCRILNYLDGQFWVDVPHDHSSLHENLGKFLAKMDASLKDFKHPSMHRHYTWDISTARDAHQKLKHIQSHEGRRLVDYFLLQFETVVLPTLSSFRHSYIHNDANDYNVLVKDDEIVGLIDFGDMVYSATINNLAVACTYAMLGSSDPLAVAESVVKGYHSSFPLEEKELSILYYLIAARLCISLTQSAYNASLSTDNAHHFITEKPAWQLIYQLIEINPIKAEDVFRIACNYTGIIHLNDSYQKIEEKRHQHIGKNLSISYQTHLKIDKGALQYLYDDKGNTYIDCVNNVSHVGHCHPVVARAMQKQIATLNTNTRYLNDHIIDYAEALLATLPKHLKVCYFTNSGSEANDLAIRISKMVTGQEDVIVLDHAYHGTSTTTIQISPYKFDKPNGIGQMPWVHKAMNPDVYRGPYQNNNGEAGTAYAASVAAIVNELKNHHKKPAAFICETLLGVGGQIPLPKNYLKEVYSIVQAAGGICIADEVQVGFGRVGSTFWGFELQDVMPDMVVMGKPIGNGHPLAAVIMTEEIAEKFNNGIEFFNTYGGNPVSMATGAAVLKVIQEEDLQTNAWKVGKVLLESLKTLMSKHTIIGDVRGEGLFIGVELVKDRTTKEPLGKEINQLVEALKNKGFLISTDGPYNNVLKIKPPIVFSEKNAIDFSKALDEVLLKA
jgi:4-aminobutyrate aminotransferase-like enzyme/Ser/Thr protein kinase RdoA (MazF antagonist)